MLQNCNTTDGFKTRIVILPIDSGYTYKNGSFCERLGRERKSWKELWRISIHP